MIIRASIYLIIFISFSILTGCAYYGGGTVGTGLPYGSGKTRPPSTSVSYIHFSGRVIDASGRTIENADITISTPQLEETATTDFYGVFGLDIISKLGDKIEVKVSYGKFTFKTALTNTGDDTTVGSATFKLLNSGKIEVINPKWSR